MNNKFFFTFTYVGKLYLLNKYKIYSYRIFRMSKNNSEPLLTDNPNRYVMFPIQDIDIWRSYKKQMDCFWRAEEIDFSKDMTHWNTLTEKEQYFIKMILLISKKKIKWSFTNILYIKKKCTFFF